MKKKLIALTLVFIASFMLTTTSFASSTADGSPPSPHAYANIWYPNNTFHGVGGTFKIPSTMSAKWYKHTNSSGQIYTDSDLFNFINFEQWIPISSGGGTEWLEGGYHDGFWLPNGVGTVDQITNYTGLFTAKSTSAGYSCWKVNGTYSAGSSYEMSIKENFTRIDSSTVTWQNTWCMYFGGTLVHSFSGTYSAIAARSIKQGFEMCIESDTLSRPVVTATTITGSFYINGKGLGTPWYYTDTTTVNDNGQTGRFGITASKTSYSDILFGNCANGSFSATN